MLASICCLHGARSLDKRSLHGRCSAFEHRDCFLFLSLCQSSKSESLKHGFTFATVTLLSRIGQNVTNRSFSFHLVFTLAKLQWALRGLFRSSAKLNLASLSSLRPVLFDRLQRPQLVETTI